MFQIIRENWNLKYSACFILCPLRENQTVPTSVSVVSRLRVTPNNHLIVHNADGINATAQQMIQSNIPRRMAVCVKPLHFNYSQVLSFIKY